MNKPEENLAELIYNKLVLLFATEADPDIRRTFGIALLNDYFHHTPDIEWEKRKEETVEYVLNMTVDNQMVYDTLTPEQKRCFHTNIRNVATKAITSRDTYWKERVKSEYGKDFEDRLVEGEGAGYEVGNKPCAVCNRGANQKMHLFCL